jgi:hypothetical protein
MSKDALRQAMPTVAAIVDEYRHLLGRVVYASENGQVIDRREPENNVFDIPPGYCKPFELKGKK